MRLADLAKNIKSFPLQNQILNFATGRGTLIASTTTIVPGLKNDQWKRRSEENVILYYAMIIKEFNKIYFDFVK